MGSGTAEDKQSPTVTLAAWRAGKSKAILELDKKQIMGHRIIIIQAYFTEQTLVPI
jgi:hypothetical protein